MSHVLTVRKWMLSIAFGVLAGLAIPAPPAAYAGSGRSAVSGLSGTHSTRKLGSLDQDLTETWASSGSTASSSARRNAGGAGLGSYNPQRVNRFWSHYHGRRSEPKHKRLEREK